jgi:hypothetical protein
MSHKKSLREHLERMKYVSGYAINETPKYKSLVGGSEFDTLPEYLKEAPSGGTGAPDAGLPPLPDATAGAPAPDASGAPAGAMPAAPPDAAPVNGTGAPTPPPENVNVDISTTAPAEQPPSEQPMPEPVETPEMLQKKAMELQLDALKKMSFKIDDLGSAVDSLNQRMEIYSDEVEEVREPSDMEKFENRKIDSSPYYYNLNDLWKGDNFKARMDQFSKGYVKTEDGYVADFDDLPKLAPHEVKASFDDF